MGSKAEKGIHGAVRQYQSVNIEIQIMRIPIPIPIPDRRRIYVREDVNVWKGLDSAEQEEDVQDWGVGSHV